MDLLTYGLRAEALVRPKTLQVGWPGSWEASSLAMLVVEADDESTDVEQEETSLGVWKEPRAVTYTGSKRLNGMFCEGFPCQS